MKPVLAILSSRLPWPLVKGDSLRLYEQIKVLAISFDLHLYCISEDYADDEAYEALTSYCVKIHLYYLSTAQRKRNIARNYFSELPMQVRYFYDRHIKSQIQSSLLELNPDHILIQLIRMAPYVQDLGVKNSSITIDFMDSMVLNDLAGGYLSKGLKRIMLRRERRLVKKYEASLMESFDNYFIISDRDRQMLSGPKKNQVKLLSNGVDFKKFHKDFSTVKSPHQYDVLFCGNMSYPPNIAAAKYLLDNIASRCMDKTVVIAGVGADSLKDYAAVTENSAILGYQEDMKTIYDSGRIMVVPIFTGSGQQNKVIEAMACGVPCIVTSFVNEAIKAESGKEVILADDAAAFVTSINDLLSHPEKMEALSKAGRTFVEHHYNWESNTQPLVEGILNSVSR